MMAHLKNIASDLMGLFFPNLCLLCQLELLSEERHICTHCLTELPHTNFKNHQVNALEQKLTGRFPFEAANALYYFNTNGQVQQVLHQIKYRQNEPLALFMGERLGQKLQSHFSNIDIIVPIPLHQKRFQERGYNQSERIAQGLIAATGLACNAQLVKRIRNTETQTLKSRQERIDNMKDAFEWNVPTSFYNKHILLVDDVITTGSTLESCILAAPPAAKLTFTILSLAVAVDS